MERLGIDEIIEHCKRKTEKYEQLNGIKNLENADLSNTFIKEYWEHRQVAEYLQELKEYRDLEEQGKLLKLPCKVGDMVWSIEKEERKICRCTVKSIEISNFCSFALIEKDFMCRERAGYIRVPLGNFSKTVFLTQEQAENVLKEMKESEGENGN